ncbi:hypothetical protein GOBAR_AA10066 [Gossypium barbadense]|uniref:Uncharacterized protein n=1 Tax=Gossypium barbadense TaxID=3634 RepID=A0A2P5Y4U5_GOSBA|nr:hypothetical protein GOBAR_AA10066 [Gossypium barbadense]
MNVARVPTHSTYKSRGRTNKRRLSSSSLSPQRRTTARLVARKTTGGCSKETMYGVGRKGYKDSGDAGVAKSAPPQLWPPQIARSCAINWKGSRRR